MTPGSSSGGGRRPTGSGEARGAKKPSGPGGAPTPRSGGRPGRPAGPSGSGRPGRPPAGKGETPAAAEKTTAVVPKPELSSYRPDLARELAARNETSFRYRQVYEHLTHHRGVPFSVATSLPGELREALEALGHSTLGLHSRADDPDGTTKLLLRAVCDKVSLETVIMRYRKRVTVCVSTQAGCSLGCAFCATGSLGLNRSLSAAEIVDQVQHASVLLAEEGRKASNVVYMGMGEPLLNLDAVLLSLRLLHDPKGWGMSARSLSVSTVGIPSGIRRMAREEPQVNLALSLHAADDALRSSLIPANRRYPLREVMRACEDHFALTRRKLFVEYLLLEGVNDSPKQATALADLLKGRVVAVNLIPWNPGWGEFRPSSPEATDAFMNALRSRNVEVSQRESRGASISAACGQLVAGTRPKRPARPQASRPDDARPSGGVTGKPKEIVPPAKSTKRRPPPTRDGR